MSITWYIDEVGLWLSLGDLLRWRYRVYVECSQQDKWSSLGPARKNGFVLYWISLALACSPFVSFFMRDKAHSILAWRQLIGNCATFVFETVRTSPSIRDAAIARLAQGTKMLKEGGRDKVFEHTFEILPQEEILKAYACYLSRPSGLVIGTLYLSNKRLVFGGDNPRQNAPSGKQEWMHYKVTFSNLPKTAFTLGLT